MAPEGTKITNSLLCLDSTEWESWPRLSSRRLIVYDESVGYTLTVWGVWSFRCTVAMVALEILHMRRYAVIKLPIILTLALITLGILFKELSSIERKFFQRCYSVHEYI